MENVSALVSKKFIKLFNSWQLTLEKLGYKNFAKVLNAKDYGVPQNRNRIFLVSILDKDAQFEFPKAIKTKKTLKDMLEETVDEKYYIQDAVWEQHLCTTDDNLKQVGRLNGGVWKKRYNCNRMVFSPDGISPTQTTCSGGGVETKIICYEQ